jgi:hypothetical protein
MAVSGKDLFILILINSLARALAKWIDDIDHGLGRSSGDPAHRRLP